jgi:dihydroneopterin aldolase
MTSHTSSPDRIEIRGLRLVGTHGVLVEEKERAQPFEVDLDLVADLTAAGRSDQLLDTVDYGAVVARVAELVAGGPSHELLESLARQLGQEVLALDGRIEQVVVTLRKLRPPLPADLASVGVRVTSVR